jgi:hypothetical protein
MRTALATVAALVLLLAGCGTDKADPGIASVGGATNAPPATSTTSDGTTEDKMRQFAKCMRDNGVDMPDPGPEGFGQGGGSNIDRSSPAFQKAMDACRSLLPGGGDLSKLDPKMIDQLTELTKCLRANGLDVPDPDPNSPMLGMEGMAKIDRNSPAAKKAFEACKDKVPGRFGQ